MAPTSLHALVRTRFFPLIFAAALLPLAAGVVWFYMMSFQSIESVLEQQTGRRAQTTAAAATTAGRVDLDTDIGPPRG